MKVYLGKHSIDFEATSPIAYTYLTSVFIPSTRGTLHARNDQELRVLAAAIDYLLDCDPARACDVLCQQFKSIEQLHHDGGSWKAARHLSVVPDGKVSVMDDAEKERLYRDERSDVKAKKLEQDVSGHRPAAR